MRCPKNVLFWAFLLIACNPVSSGESTPSIEDGNGSEMDAEAEGSEGVGIIKQINRVNDDGTYTYGYEADDGSFKIETRDVLGNVKGMFGFIDENGQLKRVSYTASNATGFQATGESDLRADRRPVLILRHPTPSPTVSPTRSGVIQHIPRRGDVTTASPPLRHQSPLVSYPEFGGKRILLSPSPHLTTTSAPQTTPQDVSQARQYPFRVLVTKRPVDDGRQHLNLIRRQLAANNLIDRQEAYSTPRRVYIDPRDVYRNMLLEQNDLKPEAPRYYLAPIDEVGPEVPAVVPMVDRVLRSRLPPLPYRPRRPQRIYDDYDHPLDLEALREEIMNYLIQYLQYRERRISPYYTPYLDQQQNYYPQQVVPRPVLPPPPPPQPPVGPPGALAIPYYYPRHLPVTPSPNIQYSASAEGGLIVGTGRQQHGSNQQQSVAATEGSLSTSRNSPLIRMLLAAAPRHRSHPLRNVEILGTAASTTPATPIAAALRSPPSSTTEPPQTNPPKKTNKEEMEADS